ncbi:MAG: DUF3169 family protein [Lachnospiraceae bacterium]|nr:DUF3169 family protein [Lachnospiraceae bacterium]
MRKEISNTQEGRIEQEDKKALSKLIPLLIVSGLIGFLAGGMIGKIRDLLQNTKLSPAEALHQGQLFLTDYACYLSFAMAIILSLTGILMYRKGVAQIRSLDPQEDGFNETLDNKISVVLLLATVQTIVSWFLFGMSFYGLSMKKDLKLPAFILGTAGFILSTIVTSILQQKMINFIKAQNPEKKGSVFDLKFHSKWMNSCDEAEQFYIYKSAYQAYKTSQMVCLVIMIALVFIGMVVPIGIVPILSVSIIWSVQSITYMLAAMKAPS